MSVFDFLRQRPSPTPTPPKIADSQKDKDKTVAAAGSIYFVKWTNKQCTMSDTCKFYNEHEANIFIEDCRRQGYYVSTWHESKDKQVAEAIEQIKAELAQVQEQEINRYKYLYAERNADYITLKARYEDALKELESIQAAQVNEHAQQQEQERAQIIAAKENAKLIIRALNPAQIEELLEQLEDNPEFELLEGPGQVRLIKYYASKILKV